MLKKNCFIIENFKYLEHKQKNKTKIEIPYEFDRDEKKLCEIPNMEYLSLSYLYHSTKIILKDNKIVSAVVPGTELD